MSRRKSDRSLSPARRRELEVAAAVAREKIMQFHVTSALRLIALASERVSPMRMLDIHMRLHLVSGAEAELLAYRVLAALGEETSTAATARLFAPGQLEVEENSGSFWHVLRSRLRGRVHHDLRRWVELAVGEAQCGMVQIHVQHAARFAAELAETHSVEQAASVYGEMVGVPAPLRGPLLIQLLGHLSALELPASPITSAAPERVGPERVGPERSGAVHAGRIVRRQAV